MAAPFFLFEPELAQWLSIAAGLAYGFWSAGSVEEVWSAIHRPKRERREKRDPWTLDAFVTCFMLCGSLAALGVFCALCAGWVIWTYDFTPKSIIWPALLLPSLLLSPALLLALASKWARGEGGPLSRLLKAIRDQGFERFHLSLLSIVAWGLGIACLFPITAFSTFHEIATKASSRDIVPIWDLAIDLPVLPATLLVAAVLFSAPRLSPACRVEYSLLARAYMDSDPIPNGRNRRAKKVLGLTVVGGGAAALFVTLYPVHVAVVSATSWMRGIEPLLETTKAVDASVARQREAGRSKAEIAAELNRIGFWSPEAPDAGLATLVEVSEGVFVDTCPVRITAGVTGPAAPGVDDRPAAEQAASDLKYCIAVSCSLPVRWRTPPALMLVSSHDSRSTLWNQRLFIDAFANGTTAGGGYCTADGRLAEDFQG
jgi:hypothetical protein